jgi:hypothetical protein
LQNKYCIMHVIVHGQHHHTVYGVGFMQKLIKMAH